MILDQSRVSAAAAGSQHFLGEDCELAEIQSAALFEMHNLTIALARFEHNCLVESAGSDVLHEGFKEFIASAVEWIKKQWNRFWAWISAKFTALKDMLIKRKGWLERNAGDLKALTNDKLAGLKVSLGDNVLTSDFTMVVDGMITGAKALVTEASAKASELTEATDKGSLSDRVRAFFGKVGGKVVSEIVKLHEGGTSIAKSTHDTLIGAEREVAVTAAIVTSCVTVAEQTYAAIDKLKGAKMVADAAIKEAEGLQRVQAGGDTKLVSQKISVLKECAPQVQNMLAAYGCPQHRQLAGHGRAGEGAGSQGQWWHRRARWRWRSRPEERRHLAAGRVHVIPAGV